MRATTPRLPFSQGGATEVPLPDALQAAIDEKLRCKELQGPAVTPDSGSVSMEIGLAVPWCSAAYRDDVRSFLKDLVRRCGEVWGGW